MENPGYAYVRRKALRFIVELFSPDLCLSRSHRSRPSMYNKGSFICTATPK